MSDADLRVLATTTFLVVRRCIICAVRFVTTVTDHVHECPRCRGSA